MRYCRKKAKLHPLAGERDIGAVPLENSVQCA